VSEGSTDDAIWTDDLVRRFGDVQELNGVNIRIPRGAIYGFLGPNGAGKSTMVHMLANDHEFDWTGFAPLIAPICTSDGVQ
jgi:ABC-2 type transport system ATP-binding protein